MLNIITGRTGSGKTRYIRNLATEIAEKEAHKAVIIVPEQFSFETERGMLRLLGNKKINNVEVLSFSRIAERLLSQYGKNDKKIADDGIRAVLMSLAIETLEDDLTIFKRYKKNPSLLSEVLEFHNELSKCRITPWQLGECASLVRKASFSAKLSELSDIFRCYDALLSKNFVDESIRLDMLCELLKEVDYFKGKTVFFDAFSGFSAQEYSIIEQILRQAEDVYVTFCCDTSKNCNRYELFYNAHTEIKKLRLIANRANIRIAPEKVLYSKKEFKKDELNFLEDNIFTSENFVYENPADAITVIPCKTKTDECEVVAAEIKRNIRENNLRYRDVAVIVRHEEDYRKDLASAFRKYGIECFHDNRQPIFTQPLIVFVRCLFDILTDGFDTEIVLRLLKTQLYGFTVEEIGLLEDYCLMWKVRPSSWKNPWTDNPKGFGEDFDEYSKELLDSINQLRARVVGPVLSLKNKLADADGETISKELFAFLRNAHIDDGLRNLTAHLKDMGENDLASEQGRVWRILTEILDGLYFATGKSAITVERYAQLFDILVSSKDVGQIPNGIDEVIIGSADRIRATAPKIVFLMGVNSGVFPGDGSGGALLNDFERCELIKNGVEIVNNLEYNSVSESFMAYHSVTLATDKLYLTYPSLSGDGTALIQSELIDEIFKLFPGCNRLSGYSSQQRIESRYSAFSVMAGEDVNGSVLGETLKKYFTENDGINELSKLAKTCKSEFFIEDKALAERLFGSSMYMSASRIERFYKCPFSYFCEYGIKAQPRREAEVDAALSGTLVHYALEIFLKENPKVSLKNISKDEVREKLDTIIDSFILEKLGGFDNKTRSFMRTVGLIKESALRVTLNLLAEFSQCKFTPADFELKINNDGKISPYEISLDKGNSVKIVGSIDRVDLYTTDDNTFVRVIDYKTGGKEFKLGEVFYGLNMQMLIYLFAIWQNGRDCYENVTPAGVLYFQAKSPRIMSDKITRESNEADSRQAALKELRMQGMVLNNLDVVNAMEDGCGGLFVPASLDKNGSLKGNVISLDTLKKLKIRVDDTIRNMALELQNGNICAFPVEDGCNWCKYKEICKREEQDPIRELVVPSFADSISMLGGDDDEKMD